MLHKIEMVLLVVLTVVVEVERNKRLEQQVGKAIKVLSLLLTYRTFRPKVL